MINSDNYNFIMINSHSCYYAVYAICFNGMSILIFIRVQIKLHLILSIFFPIRAIFFIAVTFSYFRLNNKFNLFCINMVDKK